MSLGNFRILLSKLKPIFFSCRNLSNSYVGESPRSTTDSPAREALVTNKVVDLLKNVTTTFIENSFSVRRLINETCFGIFLLAMKITCSVFLCVAKQANLRFVLLLTQLQLNLRSYNEELRQHLIEARKELEQNNRELSLKKQVFIIKES